MLDAIEFVALAPHKDDRGDLISLELGAPLTFQPHRNFFIRNVPFGQFRAQHAVSCDEFLVLQSGKCRLTIKSLAGVESYDLTDLDTGVFIPAGLWIELSHFSADAQVLVNCSQRYVDVQYFSEPQR